MIEAAQQVYAGEQAIVRWEGVQVQDLNQFRLYLSGNVKPRLEDHAGRDELLAEIRGLGSTGFGIAHLEDLIENESVEVKDWEVGEALAECILSDKYDVIWPWNMMRDSRNPLASDQGADLVGFIEIDGQVRFLFGEVKVSHDTGTPPGVMSGKSGMIQQLERLAEEPHLHGQLITWLYHRCKHDYDLMEKYKAALAFHGDNESKGTYLFGVLLRDTSPQQDDLRTRGTALGNSLVEPTSGKLDAWYLPIPIAQWPAVIDENNEEEEESND